MNRLRSEENMKQPQKFFQFLIPTLILFLQIPGSSQVQEIIPNITLSPGHGWNKDGIIDPGAINGDLIEKDINLDVAKSAKSYLDRCPVDVYLTRNGDTPEHSLEDVDEIVNGYDPTMGISIHTNSGNGNPSGSEAWYTVGGHDDSSSKRLATILTDTISEFLQINNRGTFPETENRHGGLYIHHWAAPSALVEIAFLQGDAELLRNNRNEFGRAIAAASLDYLEINKYCADWAISEGFIIGTYFPGETQTSEIQLRNDGLIEWDPLKYFLVNSGNSFGADDMYPLFERTPVNELASWQIPITAPSKPGIYEQKWLLQGEVGSVGKPTTVHIIVVPIEARQLKEDIDHRIEELRMRGEEELDKFIEQLKQEAIDWFAEELPHLICPQQILATSFVIGSLFVFKVKRKK
jgi:N-acetylmuramoyl-L-alanine amidase